MKFHQIPVPSALWTTGVRQQGSTGSEGQPVLDVDFSPVQRSTSAVPSLFPLGDPTLPALGPWARSLQAPNNAGVPPVARAWSPSAAAGA